jgi:hypothetical protein
MQLQSSVGQGDTKRARKVVPALAPIKTPLGKWLALEQTDLNTDPAKPSGTCNGHLVAQPLVAQIFVRAKCPRNRNAKPPSKMSVTSPSESQLLRPLALCGG